ncbi:MAG TPA: septum site-determining protein MinC [Lachnospiraceae bacterium]|nr:septum site-determining protein MinC [Lachnospiraceae bacterium]
MDGTVVIKGSKSGIILVLSPDASYETLKEDIAAKFKASAAFFGEAQKAISFKGHKLSDEQKMEIINVIQQNCQLSIPCIIEEDPVTEEAFREALEKNLSGNNSSSTGQFYKGNLRSGQVLDVETSIVIIGDIKPGAKVISKGNVIILGSLQGNVYAGAAGNTNAFVVALDMHPVQIRIADAIARSPDSPVKKGKGRGKKQKNTVRETKIAFLENGNIYIEPLDRDVISDIRL